MLRKRWLFRWLNISYISIVTLICKLQRKKKQKQKQIPLIHYLFFFVLFFVLIPNNQIFGLFSKQWSGRAPGSEILGWSLSALLLFVWLGAITPSPTWFSSSPVGMGLVDTGVPEGAAFTLQGVAASQLSCAGLLTCAEDGRHLAGHDTSRRSWCHVLHGFWVETFALLLLLCL